MNRVLAPLLDRVTYRRWACLIVGGALLMPYMMAGEAATALWRPTSDAGDPLLSVQLLIFIGVLPVVAVSGLFLPIRAFEAAAARTLLGVAVEAPLSPVQRTWSERRRTAAWFTLHLGIGGLVSGMTLAMVPFAVWLAVLPLAGDHLGLVDSGLHGGWATMWGPPAGVAVLVCLLFLAVGAGALLARLAPALLGPSAADRLALAHRAAHRLAVRNRLARELHDSVGHALSVVTVQAAAAGRVLDRNPAAARAALEAIETSARNALDELDHVIGVLREGAGRASPEPSLGDLPALLDAAVTGDRPIVRRLGDLSGVPPVISREAYRVAQEALTNAIRHGTGPVEVDAEVRDRVLELRVRNEVRAHRRRSITGSRRRDRNGGGAGHGLDGIRERVTLLGGRVDAGADGETWLVEVRVPLPGADAARLPEARA
ncbi:Histidine kinase [Microbispora rosea]|uniref:histidine kinase n=1 Tax=Microbispora rosea TaxID=58117 RepID=A0A1N7FVR4_9ACTN|nr:histidine kinase [Microbispora rosea]GIH52441.1 histidine kinase [Microbispora rosea subsp. rosea]SIS04377.1 Histidine kinase [Microbispora rosea]